MTEVWGRWTYLTQTHGGMIIQALTGDDSGCSLVHVPAGVGGQTPWKDPETTMTGKSTKWSLIAALALCLTLFSATAAGAQESIDIDVTPGTTDVLEVTVTAEGLDEFEGGRAVVYQCANADAAGEAISPTEDDCFAPSNTDQYLIGEVVDGTFTTTYSLKTANIGANAASCIGVPPATSSCQIVVAASKDGRAAIAGAPVDSIVSSAVEAGGSSGLSELPDTGLSASQTMVLMAFGLGLAYLGYLSWSAASPARVSTKRQ